MSDTESEMNDLNIISNRYVNDVTLNLLMNRSQHIKYVLKTNPQEYKHIQQHTASLRKYKKQILDITTDLLNTPDKQITTDVNELFQGYTKVLIRYFKMKELENNTSVNSSDEDVMFGNVDDSEDEDESSQDDKQPSDVSSTIFSLWGDQLIKKN